MELTIGIQNKETTEAGTLIITMNPVNTAKWIATPELIEAEIAVQSYGVISIPNYEDLDASSLMCYVSLDFVTYQAALADIIAGDIGDEITFSGGGGGGANDAEITKKILGQSYSLVDSSVSYVGSSAFLNDKKITYMTATAATSIGESAFYQASGLLGVSFPEASFISNNAFCSCYSLESVYMPEVTFIGSYVFSNCSKLQSFDFTKVQSIYDGAFYNCKSLVGSINAPSLITMKSSAFMSTGITKIDMPLLRNVGGNAFNRCSSLSEVSLPEASVLEAAVFANCTALTEVTLPKIGNVGSNAFASCTNLTQITFGDLSSIYGSAFNGCTKLESVYITDRFSNKAPSCQTNAFDSTPIKNSTYLGYFGSIYVESSMYSYYETHTQWQTFLSRIVSI